jgi:hypothetical protein
MEQIRTLDQMLEVAKKLCAESGKKRVSVAMAEDAGLLSAIDDANKFGLIDATLVGNTEKMKACAAEAKIDISKYKLIEEKSEAGCGLTAVIPHPASDFSSIKLYLLISILASAAHAFIFSILPTSVASISPNLFASSIADSNPASSAIATETRFLPLPAHIFFATSSI